MIIGECSKWMKRRKIKKKKKIYEKGTKNMAFYDDHAFNSRHCVVFLYFFFVMSSSCMACTVSCVVSVLNPRFLFWMTSSHKFITRQYPFSKIARESSITLFDRLLWNRFTPKISITPTNNHFYSAHGIDLPSRTILQYSSTHFVFIYFARCCRSVCVFFFVFGISV